MATLGAFLGRVMGRNPTAVAVRFLASTSVAPGASVALTAELASVTATLDCATATTATDDDDDNVESMGVAIFVSADALAPEVDELDDGAAASGLSRHTEPDDDEAAACKATAAARASALAWRRVDAAASR